ncbi:AAA family ATPase [Xenorhabdus sp. 18]|nr:AAA family ATPase [Xenorhabdus sp. 18]MBD2797488.1 AAA family ATPase [Xenorhabdus sp. 18]
MYSENECKQHTETLTSLIERADKAITEEDFDFLMNFYTENGSLVVRDGLNVSGKPSLHKAFLAIAQYFNHSLKVSQGKIKAIFGEDCALVLAETILSAKLENGASFDTVRKATYVFKLIDGNWLCVIDNSYGTDLLREDNDVKVHFMCGKIASGKSTLARSLAQEKQTILLSEDEWLAALYPNQITQLSHYVEKSQLIKSVLESHIISLIKMGNTIVLDFPANTPKQREWLKGVADKAGVVSLCHVLAVDDQECKKRLSIRNQSDGNPFKTSESAFDLITQHFSYPSEDEKLSIKYYS